MRRRLQFEYTLNIKMKRVLYLTNIEVPYRVIFFNALSTQCDLTVMYERRKSRNRDSNWSNAIRKYFAVEYLDGRTIGNEYGFSFRIISLLRKNWDVVIIGCYNSKVQMLAMAYMKTCGIPYIINIDGEPFIGTGIKACIKKFILKGAYAYLTAGVKAGDSLKAAIGSKTISSYFFSSLTKDEIVNHANSHVKREEFILVVGQYFDYKGMDVAFKVASMDKSNHYKFIGMGTRTDIFIHDMGEIPQNIEIIPFLQKNELEMEYQKCAMLLLPTRQECWGLVVNEAASFGTPIVSTWGSGAAVEIISDMYPQYLAPPGDADSLLACVYNCRANDNKEYSAYLKRISEQYTIERNVKVHLNVIESI